ncbi:hypothetical protein NU08_3536 [Flavobacterium anhuiense]|uniref:Uncharacterized protein n=1 Tax=Flavobacterium anhuiense TaxID=459526 RepID=A0A444VW23_9FLAO|nr:hypothetical protein NU08_3536 [Flavobacterium anhuiense]
MLYKLFKKNSKNSINKNIKNIFKPKKMTIIYFKNNFKIKNKKSLVN